MDLNIVIYDSKWKVFVFWTVGQTKEAVWRRQFGLWEIVRSIFHNLFFFFLGRFIDR